MSPGRRTVVVAIGGNALSPSGESASVANQFRHTRESLVSIVNLAREGWNIAIVHGNGPQVGDELLRNGVARNEVEQLPLGVLVAATAGWIGYMIQQSLQNALVGTGGDRRTGHIDDTDSHSNTVCLFRPGSEPMSAGNFIIRRKTLISMLFIGLVMLGFISQRRLPVELIPDIELR